MRATAAVTLKGDVPGFTRTKEQEGGRTWVPGPGADRWPATPKAAHVKICIGQKEPEVFCDQNPAPTQPWGSARRWIA